jgi:hypothetical protein
MNKRLRRLGLVGVLLAAVVSVAAAANAEARAARQWPGGVDVVARDCAPKDRMPIIRCIPGEAERVRATPGWRIDSDIVAWVR